MHEILVPILDGTSEYMVKPVGFKKGKSMGYSTARIEGLENHSFCCCRGTTGNNVTPFNIMALLSILPVVAYGGNAYTSSWSHGCWKTMGSGTVSMCIGSFLFLMKVCYFQGRLLPAKD